MNARDEFSAAGRWPPFMDLQVKVEGPVVAHLQGAFAEDWLFTTGESLDGDAFFPTLRRAGPVVAAASPTVRTRTSRRSAGCSSARSPPRGGGCES
jgi:phosphatidylserine/phosphatidylglycerophosphate/cardiolipin synthase-like enzyme